MLRAWRTKSDRSLSPLAKAGDYGRSTRKLLKIQDATLATTKLSKINGSPLSCERQSPASVGGQRPDSSHLREHGLWPRFAVLTHHSSSSCDGPFLSPLWFCSRAETGNLTRSSRSVKTSSNLFFSGSTSRKLAEKLARAMLALAFTATAEPIYFLQRFASSRNGSRLGSTA